MAINVRHADALLHRTSRKAVAVALNYADHAAEMASEADRASPYWFFKPTSSYLAERSGPILLPKGAVVHHEVELGVVIARQCRNVRACDARDYIAGYVCAIDVTARNWQQEAKQQGRPWSLAKGCDTFLPLSDIVPADSVVLREDGVVDVQLYLDVNGERRQSGSTRDMIWKVPELIERVSQFVSLDAWDLLLTGTPKGVAPLVHGDHVCAGIDGLVEMNFVAQQL